MLIMVAFMLGLVGESAFINQRRKGELFPLNHISRVGSFLAIAIPTLFGYFSMPVLKDLGLWDWIYFPVLFLLAVNSVIVGRLTSLFGWSVYIMFTRPSILLTNIQRSAFLVGVFSLVCTYLMMIVLWGPTWSEYKTVDYRLYILLIFGSMSVLIYYCLSFFRDVSIMIIFANGDIDVIALLIIKLRLVLELKYHYYYNRNKAIIRLKRHLQRIKLEQKGVALQKQREAQANVTTN